MSFLSPSEFSYTFFQSLTILFLHLAFTRAREDKRVNLNIRNQQNAYKRLALILFLSIHKNDTLSFSLVLFHAYILYGTIDRTHDSYKGLLKLPFLLTYLSQCDLLDLVSFKMESSPTSFSFFLRIPFLVFSFTQALVNLSSLPVLTQ